VPDKTRVAILGGGMAGLAAALELTAPELDDRYEVTVYTIGWRLGGKGASSRNADKGNRIEEHGLHVWFGFYDNAFDMMRRTYAELDPPQHIEDHFLPCDEIVLGEQWKGQWVLRAFHPPFKPGEPGTASEQVEFWDAAEAALGWIRDMWQRASTPEAMLRRLRTFGAIAAHWLCGRRALLSPSALRPAGIQRNLSAAAWTASQGLSALAANVAPGALPTPVTDELLRRRVADVRADGARDMKHVPQLAHELSARRAAARRPLGDQPHTPIVTDLTRQFRDWLWDTIVEPGVDDPELRYLFYAVDLVTAALTGIVEEDLAERGLGAINDWDLRAWLEHHGAKEISTQHAPFIRGLYDLAFAYRDGDTSRPDLAAGKALQALVRMSSGYSGALMYKLSAGMGETVFAPIYEVLRKRGVRFRFFNQVTQLHVEQRMVTRVDIQPQAGLLADLYEPLVNGAWPSEPLWDQLDHGDALKAEKIDLEHGRDPDAPEPYSLSLDADENGFDKVVLAMSLEPMRDTCGEVAAAVPAFKDMLDNLSTVATQSLQMWLTRSLRDVGWRFAIDSIVSAFHEPLATLAAMGHLLDQESHAPHVSDIAYSCGPLTHDEAARPTDKTLEYLGEGVAVFLRTAATTPSTFEWDPLIDPNTGTSLIDDTYERANTHGSDRYVTTYAGSVKYRLAPDESGLANLVLAGDWTRNGIDGGCMEAAAASGRLAARAISGHPATVPGTTGWLADQGWSAGAGTFVEYGGLTTIPSPYRSENALLHGFWARADRAKLDALCRRVFTDPSGGAADFRAIGAHVMLTWGRIPRVSSLDPAFADLGSVDENQVAVWVPVVRVREEIPGVPIPESFAMFVPFIWLNNPMSLTTGREVLAYAKTWGVPRFPDDAAANTPFGLEAFGLKEKGEQAALHPLLDVAAEDAEGAADGPLLTLHDTAWHAIGELLPDRPEALEAGFALPAELLGDIARSRLRSVFLKQIRGVEGANTAALQQITETSYIVRNMRARPLAGRYRLKLHPMASQPLADELGLEDQVLALGYRCEMDFDVRNSRVLWQP
jgi:uncharacterized protein with NAD-binding domain and iron-sulfur cluster